MRLGSLSLCVCLCVRVCVWHGLRVVYPFSIRNARVRVSLPCSEKPCCRILHRKHFYSSVVLRKKNYLRPIQRCWLPPPRAPDVLSSTRLSFTAVLAGCDRNHWRKVVAVVPIRRGVHRVNGGASNSNGLLPMVRNSQASPSRLSPLTAGHSMKACDGREDV